MSAGEQVSHVEPGGEHVVLAADRVGFAVRRGEPILDDVSLEIAPGDSIGIVGRSGAGKSTLLRLLLGLLTPTSGAVRFDGGPLPRRRAAQHRFRRLVQYVPQDPVGSLEPRWEVRRTLLEPLRCLQVPGDHERLISDALAAVDLDPALASRRPSGLSGGQAQRVAVARALATGARILLADEPLSSVDRPLREDLLRLLHRLNTAADVGLVLVSHDLPAVARLCRTSLVLEAGRLVEEGPTGTLVRSPAHPATRALLESIPSLDRHAVGSATPPPPSPSPSEEHR